MTLIVDFGNLFYGAQKAGLGRIDYKAYVEALPPPLTRQRIGFSPTYDNCESFFQFLRGQLEFIVHTKPPRLIGAYNVTDFNGHIATLLHTTPGDIVLGSSNLDLLPAIKHVGQRVIIYAPHVSKKFDPWVKEIKRIPETLAFKEKTNGNDNTTK